MNAVKATLRALFLDPFAVKLVLLVTLCVNAVPTIQFVTGRYVKFLLLWGMIVLLIDLFARRRALRNRYAGFFVLFTASYLVTIWLNRAGGGLSAGVSTVAYMVLFFFVLFAYDTEKTAERVRFEVHTLARVFIVVTALLTLGCLATYVFSINVQYMQLTTENYSTWIVYGMSENRLYGLYNPNTGSTLNLLSSAFCLLLLADGVKSWWERTLLGLNLVLQYLCMVLTLSRTAWFMYAFFLALYVFFVLPRFHRLRLPALAVCAKTACAVAAAAAVILIASPVKAVLSYVPSLVSGAEVIEAPAANATAAITPPPAVIFPAAVDPLVLDRTDDPQNGGVLTGRPYLWKGGWHAFLDHPAFGTSYTGMYNAVSPYVPEDWRGYLLRGGLHNSAVMVLTCSGGVGFAWMLLFLLISGGRALKWLWRRRFDRSAALQNTLTILLLTILGTEMFESRILYSITIFGVVFWVVYGYAMQLTDACEPKKAACGGVYNRLARRLRDRKPIA